MRTHLNIQKRLSSAVLALLVALSAFLVSVKDSKGNPVFLPLIIGVEIIAAMGVGAAIEMYDGAPVASGAVGQQALSVTIGNTADGQVRVPTTSSGDSAASIPAPTSTAPVTVNNPAVDVWNTGANPVCPTYSPASGICYKQASYPCSSPTTCSVTYETWCPTNQQCVNPQGQIVTGPVFLSNTTIITAANGTAIPPCSAGYTASGTTCNRTDTRQIENDKKQDFARTGATYTGMSGDLAGTTQGVRETTNTANDTVKVSGMSNSGQPRVVKVTADPAGGSKVEQITQKVDGAGNTYIENRTYNIDTQGKITSATQDAKTGSLVAGTTGTGYTVSSTGTVYTPVAGTSAAAGGGAGANDYARQGEAASAASSIISAVNPGAVAPSITYGDVLRDTEKTALESLADPSIVRDGSWWPSILPGTATACHGIEFRGAINTGPAAGLDSTTELDICPYLEVGRQIFGFLFGVATLIYIWRRFTGSNGGGL